MERVVVKERLVQPYKSVYRCKTKDNPKDIFVVHEYNFENEQLAIEAFNEIQKIQNIRHKNILHYRGVHLKGCKLELEMPEFPFTLATFKESMKDTLFPERIIIEIGIQLCDVVGTLAANNLVHRALKPSNIYIDCDPLQWIHGNVQPNIIVGDFGFPSRFTVGMKHLNVGSLYHVSPYVIIKNICNERTDLFSVGTILLYLMTGIERPLYYELAVSRLRSDIKDMIKKAVCSSYSEEIYIILKDLYATNSRRNHADIIRGFKMLIEADRHCLTIHESFEHLPKNTWHKVQTVSSFDGHPGRRSYHSGVFYEGKIYIFGGFDIILHPVRLNDVWEFDITSRIWKNVNTTAMTNMDVPPKMSGHCACVHNNEMIVFAGKTSGSTWINNMYALDLKKFRWRFVKQNGIAPPPRSSHILLKYKNSLITFGGYRGKNIYYNDTWQFDLSTWSWEELKCTGDIPMPRWCHTGEIYKDKLYIFGGQGIFKQQRLNDMIALDLNSHIWKIITLVGDIPTRRSGMKAEVYGNSIYIYGGYADPLSIDERGRYHDEIYEFNCNTNRIKLVPINGYTCPRRSNHISIVYKNFLFVLFGYADSQRKSDVHIFSFGVDPTTYSYLKRVEKKELIDVIITTTK